MRPYPSLPLTREHALDRLLEVVELVTAGEHSCFYALGRGGTDPGARFPWDRANRLDCTGLVAWALGYDRKQPGARGGYLNSTEILRQATTEGARMWDWFDVVPASEPVLPMDVLVFGWFDRDRDGDDDPGHAALITKVDERFLRGGPRWWELLEMADCSPRNYTPRNRARAVARGNAARFKSRGTIVRFNLFT
jgi:hypothetical protein